MQNQVKCSLITAFLSKTTDRFHEYNESKSLEERFALVAQIEGISGVECVYPYEVNDPDQLNQLLKKNNLSLSAINVNVKAEPEFRNGGLTSIDAGIRAKAVQFIKNAKDFAQQTGADKVTCCPLGDGYEFAFQCDYGQMWKFMADSFAEAGSYKPEIPLFLEYKPSETRGRCFLDTASKALCMLNEIGIEQIGITMDFGHSKYGQENPAEVVALLAHSRFPYYIHINDNNGKWDWDYMVASHNFIEYVEFLYYLKKYDYSDFMTSDTSPTRWDIAGTFEANARMTNKIWNKLGQIDTEKFETLIAKGDFLETWKYIESTFFAL